MDQYFESAKSTGLVEIRPQNGCESGSAIVWLGPGNPWTFLPYGVMDAYWSGGNLIIKMEGGQVRRYTSCYDYDIIR
jgi:hypothetical protein